MSIQCCTVHAETIVNITMFKYFFLTEIPPHLSFFISACIHRVIFLLKAHQVYIPSQTKYQKLRIIHILLFMGPC